jgi:hypothetical protein
MFEKTMIQETKTEKSLSPCIFGAEIKDVCPVMQVLVRNPEFEKYIKPRSEFLEVLKQGLETVTSHFAQIHYFCAICPFLSKFKGEG